MKKWLLYSLSVIFIPFSALAVNFKMESTQALLTANEREYRMELKNTNKMPMLLVTKIENQVGEADYANQIMVFPPVIRIEPGATQFVRLRLKQDAPPLSQDTLLRLNMTGIGQTPEGNSVGIGISQVIPLVVRSASYSDASPVWSGLRWQQRGNQLVLNNPGERLIRLQPELRLNGGSSDLQLPRAYLRPQETLSLPITSGLINSVEITPFDKKGIPDKPVSIARQ